MLDDDDLKQEALDLIQKIGSNYWNDYNEHDPGITILEELCLSIMDADYKLSFPISDIVAQNPDEDNDETVQLYTADQLFNISPTTVDDYLKLILSINCIRNAYIHPIKGDNKVSGCYEVYLYIEDPYHNFYDVNAVINNVKKSLFTNRNLCEKFVKIEPFKIVDIYITATILLEFLLNLQSDICVELYRNILIDIQVYFIPTVKYSSLNDVYEYGKTLDEIYDGPRLKCGFITDEELNKNRVKHCFDKNNVLNIISKIKGIHSITNFNVYFSDTDQLADNHFTINYDQVFRINFTKSNFTFLYENKLLTYSKYVAIKLTKRYYNVTNKKVQNDNYELAIYEQDYRDLNYYYSLQNEFPLIYGVGHEGYWDSTDLKAKRNIQELKGYLLFFDQLMKYKFSMLDKFKHYISINNNYIKDISDQIIDSVPYLDDIIKNYSVDNENEDSIFNIQRQYILSKFINNDLSSDVRSNYNNYIKLLIDFFEKNTRSNMLRILTNQIMNKYFMLDDETDEQNANTLLQYKETLIKTLPRLNTIRNLGMNIAYKNHIWENSNNVSSFEKIISLLLGIKNIQHRKLANDIKYKFQIWHDLDSKTSAYNLYHNNENNSVVFKGPFEDIQYIILKYAGNSHNYIIEYNNESKRYIIKLLINENSSQYIELEPSDGYLQNYDDAVNLIDRCSKSIADFNINSEGFHMVEHILLSNSINIDSKKDIYSYTISLFLPNWPERFQQNYFKVHLNEIIKIAIPAYIKVNIIWLNIEQMANFEYRYMTWYQTICNPLSPQNEIENKNNELLDFIKKYIK